jgi:uncharacterized membrane protein YccC
MASNGIIRGPRNLSFALANTAAVLGALYIAFAFDLERPYWAMLTVFIIAKPISGAVRSKAVYRFLGTAAGAAMALLLVPPLVQAPVLLCLAIAGWVSICLYFSLLDRTPRSYAFMLAGYTAAIVAFSVVDRPQAIFDTAVARLEEISLGILCAAIAHSVFFPQDIATRLNERIDRTIQASATWVAEALKRSPRRAEARQHQRLAQVVTELHVLHTHVSFETSEIPRAGGIMRALQARFALLAAHLTSVQQALAVLHAQAGPGPRLAGLVEDASRWARTLADSIGMAGWREPPPPPVLTHGDDAGNGRSLLERAAADRLVALLTTLAESRALASSLKDPASPLPIDLQPEAGLGDRRTLHLDRGIALLSAVAAAVACLIACALWIALSWPEGGIAAQFAAIGCSLSATLDKPVKLIRATTLGILVALPFGALYVFAALPAIDGFASLALVLSPLMLLLGFAQASEKFEGPALVFAVGLSGALALQSSYQADFSVFMNSNVAEIVGLLLAAVTVVVIRTIDPRWHAARISRSGWRAVSRIALHGDTDVQSWALTMFDRVGLVMSRLPDDDLPDTGARHVDPLRDLRVGLDIAALRRAERELPYDIQAPLRRVRSDVARAYDQLASDRFIKSELSRSIATGIASLATQPTSTGKRAAMNALTLMRLDLAFVAEPQLADEVAQ